MGEGNLQQLIIIGLFLLFTLFEAVGRVIKKRSKGRSAEAEPDLWIEEPVVERPMPAPPPASSPRAALERAAPERVSASQRASVPRASAPRVATVRVAPVRVPSARTASAGMTALDRLDTSRAGRANDGAPLLDADDARRAILAMTILGPCRAFEPHADPSGSR